MCWDFFVIRAAGRHLSVSANKDLRTGTGLCAAAGSRQVRQGAASGPCHLLSLFTSFLPSGKDKTPKKSASRTWNLKLEGHVKLGWPLCLLESFRTLPNFLMRKLYLGRGRALQSHRACFSQNLTQKPEQGLVIDQVRVIGRSQ